MRIMAAVFKIAAKIILIEEIFIDFILFYWND